MCTKAKEITMLHKRYNRNMERSGSTHQSKQNCKARNGHLATALLGVGKLQSTGMGHFQQRSALEMTSPE